MREIIGKLEEGLGKVNDKVLAGCAALYCSGVGDVVCHAGENVDVVTEPVNYIPGTIMIASLGIDCYLGNSSNPNMKRLGEMVGALGIGIAIGAYAFT